MKSCSVNGKDWVELNDREWAICSQISSRDQAITFGELRKDSIHYTKKSCQEYYEDFRFMDW